MFILRRNNTGRTGAISSWLGFRRYQLRSARTTTTSTKLSSNELEKDVYSVFVPPSEYRERQKSLMSLVSEKQEARSKSILLLITSARRLLQADTIIPSIYYKQNSDFLYFTGFNTKDATNCVLAILGGNGEECKTILFAPRVEQHQSWWEGPGISEADKLAICDDVQNVKHLDDFLSKHLERWMYVSKYGLSSHGRLASRTKTEGGQILQLYNGQLSNIKYNELSPFIDQLKLIKSPNELRSMRRTCFIGAKAMCKTMNWTKDAHVYNYENFNIPLVHENQIAAKFDYESRLNGATKIAYPSVCATGQRSTIIHYGNNNKFAPPNDWILMDAGCEDLEGYNSDISRSWNLKSESTSGLHFALYQALQEVHRELIQNIEVYKTSLDSLFQLMCHLLGKVLIEFGVCSKHASQSEAFRTAYHYCPHHVAHYLGLDVHDTPTVSRAIPLKPGMCFTIEPGLYFRESDDIKAEFKGIGLRVEDDVCINENGQVEVLTDGCPYFIKSS